MEWAKNEGIQVKDIDDLVKVGRLKNAIFEVNLREKNLSEAISIFCL